MGLVLADGLLFVAVALVVGGVVVFHHLRGGAVLRGQRRLHIPIHLARLLVRREERDAELGDPRVRHETPQHGVVPVQRPLELVISLRIHFHEVQALVREQLLQGGGVRAPRNVGEAIPLGGEGMGSGSNEACESQRSQTHPSFTHGVVVLPW